MNAKEALDRVREDGGDAETWRVIEAELWKLVERVTRDAEYREVAVGAVRAKLADQASAGELEEIHCPEAWLSKALRWRVLDEVERRARRAKVAEKAAEAERLRRELEAREPEPFGERLVERMEEVYEKAVSRRDPWQRDHLARAWRQIKALHETRRTLKEIVAADDGIDPADADAVRLAVQRAHKQHQRARADLLDAVDALVAQRKLDADTAALVRGAITRLKRRQDRTDRGVSRLKGQPDDT